MNSCKWVCKVCEEEQYMPDKVIQAGGYHCAVCGSDEFLYVCNGIKHEMHGKKKILNASMSVKDEDDESIIESY